jgi:hypothetical protein
MNEPQPPAPTPRAAVPPERSGKGVLAIMTLIVVIGVGAAILLQVLLREPANYKASPPPPPPMRAPGG